jgi:hypothetical protein
MFAQIPKTLQNQQAAGAAAHFFVFQFPGSGMRNKYGFTASRYDFRQISPPIPLDPRQISARSTTMSIMCSRWSAVVA